MPQPNAKRHTVVPVRGTPGGWIDWWDDELDHAALRARAEEAELQQDAFAAGEVTRCQISARCSWGKRASSRAWDSLCGTLSAIAESSRRNLASFSFW